MLSRQAIIDHLVAQLSPLPLFRAAWLGGSDATSRTDDLSDVDLFLIVEPGSIEPAVAAFDATLGQLTPIRLRLRLPMPTWHGFHQAFYQLENAPEHRMVDWLMIERGQPHPWLEAERHGTPIVLFDKDRQVITTHVDRAAIDAGVQKRVDELRVRFQMFKHMPPKLVTRGMPLDAHHFYQSLIVRPLVDLLRAVHCPDRHDYGFRYLQTDLPADASEAVLRLTYLSSSSDIPERVAEASALFESTLALWDGRPR
jgi:hypothetical protein